MGNSGAKRRGSTWQLPTGSRKNAQLPDGQAPNQVASDYSQNHPFQICPHRKANPNH
jgi:hypothetical protein